jgi:hypothetical protein
MNIDLMKQVIYSLNVSNTLTDKFMKLSENDFRFKYTITYGAEKHYQILYAFNDENELARKVVLNPNLLIMFLMKNVGVSDLIRDYEVSVNIDLVDDEETSYIELFSQHEIMNPFHVYDKTTVNQALDLYYFFEGVTQ